MRKIKLDKRWIFTTCRNTKKISFMILGINCFEPHCDIIFNDVYGAICRFTKIYYGAYLVNFYINVRARYFVIRARPARGSMA